MSTSRTTTDARGGAAPARTESAAAQIPPGTMQIGQHLVDLPDPAKARTPISMMSAFSEVERHAYAECCSHGLSAEEKVPQRDLARFIWRCVRSGLDPFNGEIVGIWRNDRRVGRKVMAIQPEVRGYLAAALRTGELVSISRPTWGPLVDLAVDGKKLTQVPEWCEVVVVRRQNGIERETVMQCFTREFYVGSNSIWDSHTRHMLAKRTKGHALLEAFADVLGDNNDDGSPADYDRGELPRDRREEPAPEPEPEPAPAKPARSIPPAVKPGATGGA